MQLQHQLTFIFPEGSIVAPASSSALAGFTNPNAHAQSSGVHCFVLRNSMFAPSSIKLQYHRFCLIWECKEMQHC